MRYDLLIKGATLVDPSRQLRERQDVAFSAGRVAVSGVDLPEGEAGRTVNAAGLVITPGLVDLHTHVYWGASHLSVDHRSIWAKSGTTTMVDAGSAGAQNFAAFRRFIMEHSQCRLLAFLHISALGLTGVGLVGESTQIRYCNVADAVRTVKEHSDVIVGIKVRAEQDAVGQNGLAPLDLALAAAEHVNLPVMVHIGHGPPALADVLSRLRTGDILTHCYTDLGDTILDSKGCVRAFVWSARQRGVWFDCGHGSRRFSYAVARAALAQGFSPDSISTDLNSLDIGHPVHDLPTTMSKLLNLGMSLEDVISCTTATPALMIGWGGRLGSLQLGSDGDLSAFEVQEGEFPLYDACGEALIGRRRLAPKFTVRSGQLVEFDDPDVRRRP